MWKIFHSLSAGLLTRARARPPAPPPPARPGQPTLPSQAAAAPTASLTRPAGEDDGNDDDDNDDDDLQRPDHGPARRAGLQGVRRAGVPSVRGGGLHTLSIDTLAISVV